jgi:hypothetical protein
MLRQVYLAVLVVLWGFCISRFYTGKTVSLHDNADKQGTM